MAGLLEKWKMYSRKYGAGSASMRYVGRRYPAVWSIIGKTATAGYLRCWKAKDGLKILNLGGGSNVGDGWLTADIDPRADVFVDCTRVLPIESNSVDRIMLEEVVEHLEYRVQLQLLRECRRILRPQGVLRITTPDFRWFSRIIASQNGETASGTVRTFIGRESANFLKWDTSSRTIAEMAVVNSIFLSHGHRFIHTDESLQEMLRASGFDFRRSFYKDQCSELGALDTHADRFEHPPEISLYYDAWKADSRGGN